MPDIDIDFCYERRQEVIDYVNRKYGSDRECVDNNVRNFWRQGRLSEMLGVL